MVVGRTLLFSRRLGKCVLIDGIAENIDAMKRETLKDFLSTLLDTALHSERRDTRSELPFQ